VAKERCKLGGVIDALDEKIVELEKSSTAKDAEIAGLKAELVQVKEDLDGATKALVEWIYHFSPFLYGVKDYPDYNGPDLEPRRRQGIATQVLERQTGEATRNNTISRERAVVLISDVALKAHAKGLAPEGVQG
jgi:hypothetical protein